MIASGLSLVGRQRFRRRTVLGDAMRYTFSIAAATCLLRFGTGSPGLAALKVASLRDARFLIWRDYAAAGTLTILAGHVSHASCLTVPRY